MDINKEREDFEAEFSKIKSDIAFWLHTWDEEMQGYNHPVMCWFWYMWQAAKATPEGFVLKLESWISVEIGTPAKFGTRVKIKRKSWDEKDNLVFIESEATYDKDSDFCELSNRSYEYETWFDHSLNKYLEEDELTHWMPLTKEAQEQK